MKKRLTLILVILLILTDQVLSDTDTTGADFLKIAIGGRFNGMGESLVGLVDDVEAINVNMAGLYDFTNLQVMLEHSEMYSIADGGLKYEAAAAAVPLRFFIPNKNDLGIIGINFFYLYLPPFNSYGLWGEILDEVQYSGMKMSLGYAREIVELERFIVAGGGTFSYVNQNLDDAAKGDITLDIGFKGKFKWPQANLRKYLGDTLNMGLVFQNVSFGGNESVENTPKGLKIGVGIKAYNMVAVDFDAIQYFSSSFKFNLGLEYILMKMVTFRVGGKLGGGQLNHFSAGMGVNYMLKGKKITLDYSLTPYQELQMVHRITLKFEMPKPKPKKKDPDKYYYEGINLFINKEYNSAIKMWKKTLKIDPSYEKARQRIEEAKQIIANEKQMEDLKDIEEDFKKYQEMKKEENK